MTTDLLNGQLGNILNLIAAIGGLGTAAMGLVDASKAFWGGPSNFGFKFIAQTINRFLPPATGGPTAFDGADILRTLKANWLNGVAVADQKAKAKALVHLQLSKGAAPALAALTGVDAAMLTSVAAKASAGGQVTTEELTVLGQFDVVLSAALDEAYERADQKYRNAAKLLAVIVATLLAVFGGWLIFADAAAGAQGDGSLARYAGSWQFWGAVLVGVGAAPVAPIVKDLASSLQAAVAAVGAARRLVP